MSVMPSLCEGLGTIHLNETVEVEVIGTVGAAFPHMEAATLNLYPTRKMKKHPGRACNPYVVGTNLERNWVILDVEIRGARIRFGATLKTDRDWPAEELASKLKDLFHQEDQSST